MFKIMIVEDDRSLVSLLVEHLHKFGFETHAVQHFDFVLREFKDYQPHLVLLDVNLPSYDGYYWCRQIRGISTCPIVFISARDSKMDQVMALENGADDYLTKPFDYDIVIAKLNSHLRRAFGSYAAPSSDRTVTLAGLTLDMERLALFYMDQKLEISHTEAKMLDEFMNKPGQVVSRDRLLEKIWDEHSYVDDNTLNVYITRVRKKLAGLGLPGVLETIRGIGYRLHPELQVESKT
ncbi:response regulator [Paenibacillus shunpengii]|uniref:Response regulator n=1 Tax=Paenibacillus shunpengii TaxID=2054424 RepID=A0ABW5SMA3_9BACL|nr:MULTISPECIES: response regulator transcription factor [unclassified Paenibacillus]OMC70801.1 DNA-binding response regulator [Paenibacillus sp. FSL H7-0326]SDW08781.1 DNA-binding response regulator, OmpR family, contains REC and winged-helix (wHTH) domain [Paenibacillus sp. PDC88]